MLALPEDAARQAVLALRRAGFDDRIFGADAIGSDEFFRSLSAQSPPMAGVDFSDNLYATAPLISDALSGDGVRWFSSFANAYGRAPTWRAATSYQSALALVHALRSAGVTSGHRSTAERRRAVVQVLSQLELDAPERSLHGIIGPIWFDASRSSVMPIAVGWGRAGHFVSAFDQLHPTEQRNVAAADDSPTPSLVVGPGGLVYERKRVVTVGVTVNRISELDVSAENFDADFFLWLKFSGDEDVTDIEFPNAVDPTTALGPPVRSSTDGRLSYRLYRVTGRFRTTLEFHDFPFDRQKLSIEIQHR